MTTYERGAVVLVPFPFTDQTAAKKRPAVIVSSDSHNASVPDFVIMAITSKIDRTKEAEGCLINDWHDAGLIKLSAIKPVMTTIEQSLVLRRLGKLSPNDMKQMEAVLRDLLDLS